MATEGQGNAPDNAGNRGADGRATLKSIAFMMGLGVTTVSRALKDAPEIGEETRRRVQMVARQVGYRPNRAGVRLRTGKTNVISLILNTEEQVMSFVSDIIFGISEILAPTAYHLIVTPYSRVNDPMEPVRYVVETGSADGIIISRTEPDDPRVRYMTERGFPFITHGRTRMGIDHAFHDYDNHAFALQAVHRLAESGRRRLALLGPSPTLTYARHMREGFSQGLAETGLTEVSFGATILDDPIDDIRQAAATLMRRADRPDGIVSGAGGAAFAIVAGLEGAGFALGRDVDVVSKQTSKILEWFRPSLGVVDEDIRDAGRELATGVLKAIAGADPATVQSIAQPLPSANTSGGARAAE